MTATISPSRAQEIIDQTPLPAGIHAVLLGPEAEAERWGLAIVREARWPNRRQVTEWGSSSMVWRERGEVTTVAQGDDTGDMHCAELLRTVDLDGRGGTDGLRAKRLREILEWAQDQPSSDEVEIGRARARVDRALDRAMARIAAGDTTGVHAEDDPYDYTTSEVFLWWEDGRLSGALLPLADHDEAAEASRECALPPGAVLGD